ncbi:MAG: calcineurin-like phosphoesterase family protein [Fimbriimonadaceae bacterium]|nr:calcineurin-like phosphoesterase family protein [Fimbriimonadaceae bacterium]
MITSAALLALSIHGLIPAQVPAPEAYVGTATGFVFDDRNGNGKKDGGEPGIPNVRVSNMREVVATDRSGKWTLGHTNDTTFFVVKPKGWMTPVDEDNVPRFYYIHKPDGSPKLRFEGVAPSGPLPASIDFPLHQQKESDKFSAIFFGDTQPRDLREVNYLSRQIIDPLIGHTEGSSFGVTLGDIVFDDLSVTMPLVKTIGLIGIPWYYVLGNHDINYDAKNDKYSDEFWEKTFGPSYYSFDSGPTHFVSLDNVLWTGAENSTNNRGSYKGGLGAEQLEWLRQDLKFVPSNQLVVVMMHIPMTDMVDREELYRILEKRPYCLSVSAHTHTQEHRFITEKEGWKGSKPHHHVVSVTTCGSWWSGAPNEFGVPHSTMRDGGPIGYSIFSFDGNQYSIQYRVAGKLPNYQMNIYAPDEMKAEDVQSFELYVNVFGGSERSKVEMSFAGGLWLPMDKALEPDPEFVKMSARDKELKPPYRALPAAANSTHLWKIKLGRTVPPGVYPIHVRTTDMFGQTYTSTRALRVN